MSIEKATQPVAKAQDVGPDVSAVKGGEDVAIVMKKEVPVGNKVLAVGEVVATIKLRPGVDLNYVTTAIGNGICGPFKGD